MDVLFSCDVATLQQPIEIQHQLITAHYSAKHTAVLLVWRIWPYNSAGFSTQGPSSTLHESTTLSKLLPWNSQQEGSVLYFFFATGSQLLKLSSVSLPPHALNVLLSLPSFASALLHLKKQLPALPTDFIILKGVKINILYIWYVQINLWT